jgi:hypothetical protein
VTVIRHVRQSRSAVVDHQSRQNSLILFGASPYRRPCWPSVAASLARRASGCRRLLKEEAHHFATGVGSTGVGVRSGCAAARPCMARAMQYPLLQQDSPGLLRKRRFHVYPLRPKRVLAATKICARRASPVGRSTITGTVSPAKSTNSLSPPTWVWRIVSATQRSSTGGMARRRLVASADRRNPLR